MGLKKQKISKDSSTEDDQQGKPPALPLVLPIQPPACDSDASSDDSSSDSSCSDVEMTANEGEETDVDEETPATYDMRGSACLVTCSCPKQYPRQLEDRKKKAQLIPEDFSKETFLAKLRNVINKKSTVTVVKATCHSEPHKRYKRSGGRRERHMHAPLLTSGNFAHKKIAEAFFKEHGIRISISFKLKRCGQSPIPHGCWQEAFH